MNGSDGTVIGETFHAHLGRVVSLKHLMKLKLLKFEDNHEYQSKQYTTTQERLSCEAQTWRLLARSVNPKPLTRWERFKRRFSV